MKLTSNLKTQNSRLELKVNNFTFSIVTLSLRSLFPASWRGKARFEICILNFGDDNV